jgi:hypothetical protein
MDEDDPTERIIDWTGNLQDGYCMPDRCPGPLQGRIDGALDFDRSVTDRVTVQSAPNWQLSTGYTISLWFRARTVNGPELDTLFSKRLGDGTQSSWRLGVRPENGGSGLLFGFEAAGSVVESTGVTVGEWTHLVGSWTPAAGQLLYVNGSQVAANAGLTDVGFDDGVIVLGAHAGASVGDAFDGAIDEVRVYRGGLDQAAIAELATCGQ